MTDSTTHFDCAVIIHLNIMLVNSFNGSAIDYFYS